MVLFMPNVLHADDCMKYKSSGSKYFHEASFDAYCVGYGRSAAIALFIQCADIHNFFIHSSVFLRMAHLVAMNGVRCVIATAALVACAVHIFRSSEARPVHFSNYLKLLEHFVNKVNVIRGPVHYIVSFMLFAHAHTLQIHATHTCICYSTCKHTCTYCSVYYSTGFWWR